MGELITLTCTSCGGKLQISSNTSVLNCQHCGTEHLVRRDSGGVSLESFARCPKCGRNDRVEKISNIIRKSLNHSKLVQGFSPPTKPQLNLKSESIAIPVMFYVVSGILLVSIVGFFIFFKVIENGSSDPFEVISVCSFICILPLSIALLIFLLFGFVIHKVRRQYKVDNEHAKNKFDYDNPKWVKAIKRWEKLYYCHRDDCVFIPNEGTYAPVEKMQQYIYQDKQVPVENSRKFSNSDPILDDIPPTT